MPIFYNVVITCVKTRCRTTPVESIIRNGRYVRHLFIGNKASRKKVFQSLEACPFVVNLAIHSVHVTSDSRSLIRRLPLQCLSMYNPDHLDTLVCSGSLECFRNLTHLDILKLDGAPWVDSGRWLKNLPALTHLSLPTTLSFVDNRFRYLEDISRPSNARLDS